MVKCFCGEEFKTWEDFFSHVALNYYKKEHGLKTEEGEGLWVKTYRLYL